MNLDLTLRTEIQKAVAALFNQSVEQIQLQPTNAEFEGSHTLVCFPIAKISKKGPEETARLIGEYLQANSGIVSRFNVVKGFLNLVISDAVWVQVFEVDLCESFIRNHSSNRKGNHGGVFFTQYQQAVALRSFEK